MVAFALLFGLFGFASPSPAQAVGPAVVDLLTAGNFVILSKTGITNVPTSVVTGNIGTSPITGAAITGVGCSEVTGSIYTVDVAGPACRTVSPTVLTTAVSAMEAAYTDAAGRAGPDGTDVGAGTLGAGTTFTPGLYKWTTGVTVTGTTTLSGGANDVWIFQIAGDLNLASAGSIASGVQIALTGGAVASNVFWQVGGGTGATLGTYSTFNGTILTAKQVILQTGAVLNGRALAQTLVTLDNNTVSLPSGSVTVAEPPAPTRSTPNTGSLTVVKSVINDNGGTRLNTSFPLFVNGSLISTGATNELITPATYTVTEGISTGYTRTFSGDCNASGVVNLVAGDNRICIITNNDNGAPAVPPVPPLIDVVKVPSPLALPNGPGPVNYTYTLTNIGTVPVTNITMVGDTCSPIVLASGDNNSNGKLEVNETWVYRCSTTLSATHTNTVTTTGWANGISAIDIASATVVVGAPVVPPLIHVTKIPSPLALTGGGTVVYTKKVTNPGSAPLSNVRVTDDKCGPVNYVSGDLNRNALLEPSEVWTYTCASNLTQTTTNTATASGDANGLTARDVAVATVVVAVPGLPNTGLPPEEGNTSPITMMVLGILTLVVVSLAVRQKLTN